MTHKETTSLDFVIDAEQHLHSRFSSPAMWNYELVAVVEGDNVEGVHVAVETVVDGDQLTAVPD